MKFLGAMVLRAAWAKADVKYRERIFKQERWRTGLATGIGGDQQLLYVAFCDVQPASAMSPRATLGSCPDAQHTVDARPQGCMVILVSW
jgi:hypothetical protein